MRNFRGSLANHSHPCGMAMARAGPCRDELCPIALATGAGNDYRPDSRSAVAHGPSMKWGVGEMSGLGVVHASPEEMHGMAQRCTRTGDDIAQGMRSLVGQIQALDGQGLDGRAAAALRDVTNQLNSGLATVRNALDGIAGKMMRAANDLTDEDEQSGQQIRSISTGGSVVTGLRG